MAYPLRIVTPSKVLYQGEVDSLQAPGSEGSFGVLTGHAPMVASLVTGGLNFVEQGDRRHLATSGGFVEVSGDGVTVLAETCEYQDEIDVERASASRDRARGRLTGSDVDRARAEASLHRALNRLRVASAGL